MKFVCDRCQTKYSIADERVRGKVLKVKCKTCANVITVREARRPSAAVAPLSAGGGGRPRSGAQAALDIPMEPPGAPRRPTPPPIPPLGAAHAPARKPTGPHAPPSPSGHAPGAPGSKLPPPGGIHPALAARGEHAAGDPSSMLETPAPMAHGLHA